MVDGDTLIAVLAKDLANAMARTSDGAQRSVVLLLDPDGQFTSLMLDLHKELAGRGVALVTLEGPDEQFATKMELLRYEAGGEYVVLYGPGSHPESLLPKSNGAPPDLWALVDYRYKGVVWDGTEHSASIQLPVAVSLDRWLEGHGVIFSDTSTRSKLTSDGATSRLARFAARRAHRTLESWPRPLSESAVRDELAGDPRESVVQLLLDPSSALSAWVDNRVDVLERIATTYGLRFGEEGPELIADNVASTLALTDAWDVFGRREDFPFITRLPRGPQQRERVLALLRTDLLHRADVLVPLRARIARLEPDLSAIGPWAADKPGIPAILPQLLASRVHGLVERLEGAWNDGPAACLMELEKALAARAMAEDAHPVLSVLNRLLTLSDLARDAREEASSITTPSKLVDLYSTKWWTIDALYLAIAEACREEHELVIPSALASHLYFGYVDTVNQLFSDLMEDRASWPPDGTKGVGEVASRVWAPSKLRQAVLIIDSLRFDLAHQVADGIGAGANLEPVVTTLPSVTPFGMAALLPAAPGEPIASYQGGELSISAGGRTDLRERAGRKQYLQAFLSARDAAESVAFVELESIVQGAAIPNARWLVAFSYSLDDRGHSPADSASLPAEAARVVARLVRSIERLHRAGIARVDVVTDHGFIYLPPDLSDSLGHPDLPVKQTVSKNPRYAVLQPGASATDVVRRPSPMGAAVSLGFPRGIRTLTKATVYQHGGISLQECVIARISSKASLVSPRLEVEIELTVTQLTGGTIPIRVRPSGVSASGQMTLDAPRPVKIVFSVEAKLDGNLTAVADPVTLEIRADTPELTSALYLGAGVTLDAGTELLVRATDAETGEALFGAALPLVVDWEG